MSLKLLVALCFLVSLTQHINVHRNFTILPNSKLLEYSPNERFIGVTNSSCFAWYNAFTGENLGLVSYQFLQNDSASTISNLEFSEDGKWVGLSFSTDKDFGGYVSAYFNLYEKSEPKTNQEQSKFVYESDESVNAKDITFLNSKYILTLFQQQILIQPLSGDQQFADYYELEDFSAQKIEALDKNTFLIAGWTKSKNIFSFFQYQYDQKSKQMNVSKVYEIQSENISKINDISVNKNSSLVYFVGDSSIIFVLDLSTSGVQDFQIPSSSLLNIQISSDDRFILTLDENSLYFLQKTDTKDEGIQTNSTIYNITKIDISVPSASLSKSGGNIIYVNEKGSSEISGFCKEGQYYVIEAGVQKCLSCNNCTLCVNSNQFQCFECKKGNYLDSQKYICMACSTHCLDCNQNTCITCSSGYSIIKGTCGCPVGKFDNNTGCSDCSENCQSCLAEDKCEQCQEGFNIYSGLCVQEGSHTVLIVLLVLAGVLIIAGIGGYILWKKKKNQKQSLLQEQATLQETTIE